MKLINAINGILAINKMLKSDTEWDFDLAHQLVLAKHSLIPHLEFYLFEEKKIRDENTNEKDINDKMLELNNVEISFTPNKAAPPKQINGAVLEALTGIVEFEEEYAHGVE